MPAPQPSAKRLCNDPLAPEAADVDWVFCIGIPEKNAQTARIHRDYLQFCLRHIKSQGKPCTNKELAEAYHACEGEARRATTVSTFVRFGKTSRLARCDVVGRQRNCQTKFHADKNSQVRLANNTTNNCGAVAGCMDPSWLIFDGKGRNCRCRAFRWSSRARPKSQRQSPGFGQLAHSLCRNRSCLHTVCDSKFRAWIASVARMVEVENGPKRVCVLWHSWRQWKKKARSYWSGSAALRCGACGHWWIAELPQGAKLSAGGNFVSVRGQCSVWSAPLQ